MLKSMLKFYQSQGRLLDCTKKGKCNNDKYQYIKTDAFEITALFKLFKTPA